MGRWSARALLSIIFASQRNLRCLAKTSGSVSTNVVCSIPCGYEEGETPHAQGRHRRRPMQESRPLRAIAEERQRSTSSSSLTHRSYPRSLSVPDTVPPHPLSSPELLFERKVLLDEERSSWAEFQIYLASKHMPRWNAAKSEAEKNPFLNDVLIDLTDSHVGIHQIRRSNRIFIDYHRFVEEIFEVYKHTTRLGGDCSAFVDISKTPVVGETISRFPIKQQHSRLTSNNGRGGTMRRDPSASKAAFSAFSASFAGLYDEDDVDAAPKRMAERWGIKGNRGEELPAGEKVVADDLGFQLTNKCAVTYVFTTEIEEDAEARAAEEFAKERSLRNRYEELKKKGALARLKNNLKMNNNRLEEEEEEEEDEGERGRKTRRRSSENGKGKKEKGKKKKKSTMMKETEEAEDEEYRLAKRLAKDARLLRQQDLKLARLMNFLDFTRQWSILGNVYAFHDKEMKSFTQWLDAVARGKRELVNLSTLDDQHFLHASLQITALISNKLEEPVPPPKRRAVSAISDGRNADSLKRSQQNLKGTRVHEG